MLSTLNPINPGDIPIPPSQEGHLVQGGKEIFAAELATALDRKNVSSDKKDAVVNLKQNLLDTLGHLPGLNFKIEQSDLQATADVLDISTNEAEKVISKIRGNLMSGIKGALQRLEDAVTDPKNKVPDGLQQQFMGAIAQIKEDFESGFGVSFNTLEESSDDKETDDLLDLLFKRKDKLPPSFLAKIEDLI